MTAPPVPAPAPGPTAAFVVGAGDPCLPGHFPGNPVVPGVVVLDRALAAGCPGQAVSALTSAKFFRPVLPGQPVTVTVDRRDGALRLRCAVGGALVAEAAFEVAPAPGRA